MSQALTIKIPIKNRNGETVGEKEVVSYAGLLAKAHDEGLESNSSELRQVPTDQNGGVAIVIATVKGRRGTFTGIGDADPGNVNRGVVRHLLRIAETRAKARALRDYVDIGTVCLEELGGDDEVDDLPESASRGAANDASVGGPMSEPQKRILWRIASAMGIEGDQVVPFLSERLGIRDSRLPSKREASRLIDELDAELRRSQSRSNGGGHRAA